MNTEYQPKKSQHPSTVIKTFAGITLIGLMSACSSQNATDDNVDQAQTAQVEQAEQSSQQLAQSQQSQQGGDMPPANNSGNGKGRPSLDDNGIDSNEPIYTFADSPATIVRGTKVDFTQPNGETHQYEAVEIPDGGINWSQAKALAEEAGGYLASITSKEENEFVFSLIDDDKFWYTWDDTHNGVKSGPFLGGYQASKDDLSDDPKQNWQWVSGEDWTYENWAYDGMDGDRDPRPNTQPNDATGGQDVLAFGEVNDRVATWGDFPHKMSSYGDTEHPAVVRGFVIEYPTQH